MTRDFVRQVAVVVAILATIVINTLANALPLNGQTTGAISDRFEVYFVPAGYVFSIWGLIYIGLVAFAVYQAMPTQREDPALRRVGWWVVAGCVANSAWIFFWHYELLPWTLLAMVGLLVSLIVTYLGLGVGRPGASRIMKWAAHVPFSIYLGWITVATVANVTAFLWAARWSGWGLSPEAWTVIMLLVGAALATLMTWTRRDIAYNLVIAWAFVGIAVKWLSVPIVAVPAGLLAGLVLVEVGWILARRRC